MKNLFVATSLSMSISIFAAIDVLDRVAIIVDEGVIMESQLQDRLQNTKIRLTEQNIQPPSEEQLLDEIKEQLIIEELQLQRGRDAGVRISDGELNQTFIRIAQNNGFSLEEFIVNYEDSGQSYEKLREEIRNDMVIQRVQQGMVGNAINITQQEIDGFLQTDEAIEQLTPELLVRQIQVATRLEADNIYQDIQSGMDFLTLVEEYSINRNKNNGGLMPWRKISAMPTVYAEALTKQPLGFVSSPIQTGAGFNILKLEDKRGPLVTFEEQWNVRHILIAPSEILDLDSTKALLTEIRDNILNGADFGELAREYSEDPGSASQGGELDWLPRGVTAPEFEAAMVNAEINVLSPIFETQFGFHFLEVLDKRTEDITDITIEDRAYSVLFARKFDEELENTLRSMRAEAFVEFKNLY